MAAPENENCQRPYVIGLTGNIATGKSTVGRMLAGLGAELIDADQVAHQVLAPGSAAYDMVIQAFGPDILTADGLVDRKKLGSIVFAHAESLRLLESLVHPPVIAFIDRQIASARALVVVVEAIKLLETGMAEKYDAIWVTTCPEEIQLARLTGLRHLAPEDARQRLQSQAPQLEKITRADVVIDTSGNLKYTQEQVWQAWQRLPVVRCQATGDVQPAGT